MSQRRAATTSSVPPPVPGGVRCAPRIPRDKPTRAELSRQSYDAAITALRSVLVALDDCAAAIEPEVVRATWLVVLQMKVRAQSTLAHLDQLNEQLWGDD